ncbi:unnamed protein product [Vitrella brassicaformis CCMP3155]|uniref:TLDc domain-containing protein n=1 Tax=Vitrella brassicaformis (strain CCMP3155) TaxID=1169540 RepID=A0A0G4EVL6_VITBC|nr:unnamed protein product [Vitrella brassicaformis CCMP3155]|eukprot:CEM02462.1 unnamed protein product [Vitrella brassicaformis CCMP3155]
MKGPSEPSLTAKSPADSGTQTDKPWHWQINVGGITMEFPRDLLLQDGLKDRCLANFGLLKAGFIKGIQLFSDDSPTHAFYHDRFFAKTTLSMTPQDDKRSEAFQNFMAVMGGFIKSSVGGTGGYEVLSVRVNGTTVATTDATLDDHSTLKDRFNKYGGPVDDVSIEHFHKVVDFLRRRRLAAPDAVTPLPTTDDWPQLLSAFEMYNLMDCHGWSHEALFNRVAGAKGGLLFVVEAECESEGHRHIFACLIDGPLIAPADPTAAVHTGRAITFYSISGAFKDESIVNITVPHDWQRVEVAGTDGAVKGTKGVGANVVIGDGRLRLGYGGIDGRSATDLHSCEQRVKRDELPAGKTYLDSYETNGWATLAGSHCFTAQRLEVYEVLTTRPADPILSDAKLQELIDMTGNTNATGKLLYKGARDGWKYPTMVAKVGTATNLLLLIKDTGDHIIAAHINGQLKQPADLTAVETTKCPVAFYSVCGAFSEADGIVEIELSEDQQYVVVAGTYAGTQGAAKSTKGVANLCIGEWPGCLGLGCCLWLGYGQNGRPAGDLRRCKQLMSTCVVESYELPGGKTYLGNYPSITSGDATLAAAQFFTCVDMEVYTLQQPSSVTSTGSG